MKVSFIAVSLSLLAGFWIAGSGEPQGQGKGVRQRGGPVGVFRTEVPESPLNVIVGAPTDRTVSLSVLSSADGKFKLEYEAADQAKNIEGDLSAGMPKVVELNDLKPDCGYSYSVQSGSAKVEGRFHTVRKPGSSFTFVVQADSHLDENSSLSVFENTLNNEIADQPDFMVDLGDTFMVDKYSDYKESEKQYEAQRYWFSKPGAHMPIFLCLGNHDGEQGWVARGGVEVSDWSRAQRQKYFPVIRPNAFYSGAPAKGLYYAWTWGDALFVVLDPFVATTRKPRTDADGWNWSLGKVQFEWLQNVLKNSSAKHKFVFIHHLVGGFGREARGGVEAASKFEWGDEDEFPTQRTGWAEPIHALLKRHKASALFHGHDHLYVRQEKDGIAYFEVPQPSAARENVNSAEEYGYKTGKLLASPGHLRVTVNPDGVKYEYVKSRLAGKNREVVDSLETTLSK